MNTQEIRRCVLYARLSVTKEESVSITRQLESCRKYAQARSWEVVGEFIDDGVSATATSPKYGKGGRRCRGKRRSIHWERPQGLIRTTVLEGEGWDH